MGRKKDYPNFDDMTLVVTHFDRILGLGQSSWGFGIEFKFEAGSLT